MADLDWQQVDDSSNVAQAALSEELGGVVVEFKDGSRYLFSGKSEADLAGLVMSPSPGSYVRRVLGTGTKIG